MGGGLGSLIGAGIGAMGVIGNIATGGTLAIGAIAAKAVGMAVTGAVVGGGVGAITDKFIKKVSDSLKEKGISEKEAYEMHKQRLRNEEDVLNRKADEKFKEYDEKIGQLKEENKALTEKLNKPGITPEEKAKLQEIIDKNETTIAELLKEKGEFKKSVERDLDALGKKFLDTQEAFINAIKNTNAPGTGKSYQTYFVFFIAAIVITMIIGLARKIYNNIMKALN